MYKICFSIAFVMLFYCNSIAQWNLLKDYRFVYQLKIKKTSFEDIVESKSKLISFSIDTVINLSDAKGYIAVLSDFFDPLCFFTTSPKYTGREDKYDFFYNQKELIKYCTFIYSHNDSVSFWNIEKKDLPLFKNSSQIKSLQNYLYNEEIIPDASATKIGSIIIRSQPFGMIKNKQYSDDSYYSLLQTKNINIPNVISQIADEYVHTLYKRHFFEMFFSSKYGILQSHSVVGKGMKSGFVWDLKLISVKKIIN